MAKVIPMKRNVNMGKNKITPKVEENPNEVRILMHCDYNCSTGFGNVAKHFIDELKKDKNYVMVIHAINDFSKETYIEDDANILVKPAYLNKKNDAYGRVDVLNALYQTDFHIFFLLNDVEIISAMMEHILNVRRQYKKEKRIPFKLVTYSPIDSTIRTIDIKQFEYIDIPITYTQYAKNHLESLNSKLNGKVQVLSHGVNTDQFFRQEDKKKWETRKRLFGEKNIDAFVFGTVNRNQVRKDMGSLLLAFSYFKKAYPKAKALLYLHCNPNDPMGLSMFRIAQRLGLDHGRDIFFPKDFNENKGVTLDELNSVYNTFDVFISTTTAEGWGLTITEVMAVEIPVISPTHTALYEVTGKGQLVEPLLVAHEMVFCNDYEKIRYVSNPEEVAFKMQKLYSALTQPLTEEWQDIQDKNKEALRFVEKLKWSEISKNFKLILDNVKNQ